MAVGKGIVGGDARIRKDDGSAAQRGTPGMEQDHEREDSDGTVMTAAERRRFFREEWQQSTLPLPPEIKGWHVCWLSTNHPSDTIHKRLKLGYKLVKRDEVPGFDVEKGVQSAANQYSDYVTCNELILAKIPMEKYQDAMAYFHHEAPLEEEGAIRTKMKGQIEEVNHEAGAAVVKTVGGGFDTLGNSRTGPPTFQG